MVPFLRMKKYESMCYQTKREELLQFYTGEGMDANDETMRARYELLSAGLINYLPDIPVEKHWAIYKEVLLHGQLSALEQSETAALELLTCEGEADKAMAYIKEQPAIICTMHMGSYRMVNTCLLRMGIPVTIVMGTDVINREGMSFLQQVNKFDLQLIDAEQGTSGLQMLRALKKGRTLLLYLDGQTGAGTETGRNENNCLVNFLRQQLYARMGIAWLAHAARVPIVPVICYRKSNTDIRLRFYPFIQNGTERERNTFAQAATQQLYTIFSELIAEYPGQWEGWLTIHRYAKLVQPLRITLTNGQKKEALVTVDSRRFGIFKTGSFAFLLDKQGYLFYPLSEELYLLLERCRQKPVEAISVEESLRSTLLTMGVLQQE